MPTATITIRVPTELLERLREIARQERRTVNNLVVKLLADALAGTPQPTKGE